MKYTIEIGKQRLTLQSDSEADAVLNGLQKLRESDDVVGTVKVVNHRSLAGVTGVKNREVRVTKET